jgi:hypothetical protein
MWRNEMEKSKNITGILLVSGLLALVILYFAFLYPKPTENQLKGTLAGVEKAEKFQDAAVTAEDVKTEGNQANDFFQSADFQNLAKSESFLKLVASQEWKAITSSSSAQEFLSVISNKAVQNVLQDAVTIKLIAANQVNQAMQSKPLQAAELNAQQATELAKLFANPHFQAMAANPVFSQVVQNVSFQSVIQNANFQQAVSSGEFNNTVLPNLMMANQTDSKAQQDSKAKPE